MVYWFAGPWQTAAQPAGDDQNDHVYGVPVYVANDPVKVDEKSFTIVGGRFAQCRVTSSEAFIASVPEPIAFVRKPGQAEVQAIKVYANKMLIIQGGQAELVESGQPGYVVVESPIPIDQDTKI